MEPKSELAVSLEGLYNDVIAYISYHVNIETADDATRKMLEQDEYKPEMPEYFALYRKLKLYSGKNGTLPFLWGGGYMEQPWVASQAIETCIAAEREYEAIIRANNERIQQSNQEARTQS